jgi:alginate export protein
MNWKRASRIVVVSLGAMVGCVAPFSTAAQSQAPQDPAPQAQGPQESSSRWLWPWLKEGKLSFNSRFRFEAFERDGAPFTGTAYAPTLRLALGYETPAYHGFSVFAQGEAVIVTGSADYSDPLLPPQNRPNLPAILDPKSLVMNQGYVKWAHGATDRNVTVTVGRQELTLNDGRFLSYSNWRQVHGSFDAARIDTDLPWNFSFTYAYINRFYREDGYNASDGEEPMHTDVVNLKWSKPSQINASLYGLLLNFRGPAQFATSTQTYGLRFTGPYQLDPDWSVLYVAEFAKQMNYGTNPNRVNENYFLGELGPGWRDFSLKAGYAFLGGRSATDLLTTPLAPPRNGWTDLFFNDPSIPAGHGLEALYGTASGPIRFLDGTVATLIYYDYHSDFPHIHYGSELDSSLAYKMKKFANRWEIGWRFGRYWADHLFTNSVRTSVYTSFTL